MIFIIELFINLFISLAIGIYAFACFFSHREIEINWAKSYLENALNHTYCGITTQIGKASLRINIKDRNIDLIVKDIKIIGCNHLVSALIESISLQLSYESLLAGKIGPRYISIINPTIDIVKKTNGNVMLTNNTIRSCKSITSLNLNSMLKLILGERSSKGMLYFLREARFSDARIRLLNNALIQTDMLAKISVNIKLFSTHTYFHIKGYAKWFNSTTTPILLSGKYQPKNNCVSAQMQFATVSAVNLTASHPHPREISWIVLAISGTVTANSTLDSKTPVIHAKLNFGEGRINISKINPVPLAVSRGNLSLKITPNAKQIYVYLSLELKKALLTIKTHAIRDPAGYAIIIDTAISNFAVNLIKDFWPFQLSDKSRKWITNNLVNGQITNATLLAKGRIDSTKPILHPLNIIYGTIKFQGIDAYYFRPLPPITKTKGLVRFDNRSITTTIQSGHLGDLSIESLNIALVNLDQNKKEYAHVNLNIRGNTREALKVIALAYPNKIAKDTQKIEGIFGAKVKLDVPLINNFNINDIGFSVSANLKKVVIPNILHDTPLTNGDLELKLNRFGMCIKGKAKIGKIPVILKHDELFQSNRPFRSRSYVSAIADVSNFTTFGLDLSAYANGPISLNALVLKDLSGNVTATIKGDLQSTSIVASELGWSKPIDAKGSFQVYITHNKNNILTIPRFEFRANSLYAAGKVAFHINGEINAVLSAFCLGRTKATGTVKRQANGSLLIFLKGPSIDLVPILTMKQHSQHNMLDFNGQKVEAKFAAERIYLIRDIRLMPGILTIKHNGVNVDNFSLIGQVNGNPMRLLIQKEQGSQLLTAETNNVGRFLNAIGITKSIKGGRLRINGILITQGLNNNKMDLIMRIDNFYIVDPPFFAHLLSLISFSGLLDALSGNGIRFAETTAHILLTLNKIKIKNASAYGSGLRIEINGTILWPSKIVDIVCLIAPCYPIAKMTKEIPIVGSLLSVVNSMLQIKIALKGNLEKPKIKINTSIALTSKFLLNMLRISKNQLIEFLQLLLLES
ncbi:hypothetical protein A1OE_170 [Candidatus Endolissoclinum faulkneri L2]|uniref:YhdP central domain-containing protein n=1 Tax=Candidatus Endolissoclinum faulkneri L2 TaxID=1193729 RepID=K7Z332_9PROT|nr:hypothetical protein A1OE_170 [Candidatus Endolissoclinum faulkneri L2]